MDLNALTLKANSGDLEACYELAMLYKTGKVVIQNDQVYEKYIKLASAKNHPKALLELGFILVSVGKIEEGIDKIKLSAKKGNIEANFYCGQIYFGTLYNQPPNYKVGYKYFETYMAEYEPQTFMYLSDFDPRIYAPDDDLVKIVGLYEKYAVPMGLYHAALYHLEAKNPNYEKAIEDLTIAHKKGHLLSTYQLFLLYYDGSKMYTDYKGKDFYKATTYYVLLINNNFKPKEINPNTQSCFMPPKGGYLDTLFDYQKYIEDYKAYIFQSVSFDSNFSTNIKDIKIIPEMILSSKPLMFYSGVLDLYKDKPKKKQTPEIIQKEVKYQNFETRPDSKTSVLTERGIYSKLNVPTGICVFEPYESDQQIQEHLLNALEAEKNKVKDRLVSTKVDLDYAYLFHPSLRVRFNYLDQTYETNLTHKDIQEGILLEGPLRPEVDKQLSRVLTSSKKPNTNLYMALNILLLLSLCAMNFLYFDRLSSPINLVVAGSSFVFMLLTYILSKTLPKKLITFRKSDLIKLNDALDFKKALKVRKQNLNRKRIPLVLEILGSLIALGLVAEVYLNLLTLI